MDISGKEFLKKKITSRFTLGWRLSEETDFCYLKSGSASSRKNPENRAEIHSAFPGSGEIRFFPVHSLPFCSGFENVPHFPDM
jgi:hypothetical protein